MEYCLLIYGIQIGKNIPHCGSGMHLYMFAGVINLVFYRRFVGTIETRYHHCNDNIGHIRSVVYSRCVVYLMGIEIATQIANRIADR